MAKAKSPALVQLNAAEADAIRAALREKVRRQRALMKAAVYLDTMLGASGLDPAITWSIDESNLATEQVG